MADTTMMRIVHDALRRDLRRAHEALTREPPPDDRQRAAIAEHLAWMMTFLEAHHRVEDVGLYPVVRERAPEAATLLDDMTRDHEVVADAAAEVATAPSPEAIDRLSEVLLPHLRREEDELMPIVARVVSDDEWRAIEQEHSLDGKSTAQLGLEGHWLIDDVGADDRARVLSLVPPLQRFVLLHGFGRRYRRRRRACWGPPQVQREGNTAVVGPAELDAVWEVVRDPTRVGEWSHECVGGEWLGGATEARPGARFRGRNAQGVVRWGRICEVVSAEPHELVWRTVPTRLYPDSTVWALRLAPADGGTRIEQAFEVVKTTAMERIYLLLIPAHADRADALREDLERLGAVAYEAGGPNQVVSDSGNPGSSGEPAQATWPSGRTRTASGAGTAPTTGSSQGPS